MAIEYQPLRGSHVEPALELVLSAYREEKQAVACLPEGHLFLDTLEKAIAGLFSRGSGIAAEKQGRLAGFLAGYETGPLFGTSNGIYCPLFGHGAIREERMAIYQGLYSRAAQAWVEKGHKSHAISLFAHDRETVDTWFWLGFGMRCVDSIRPAEAIFVHTPDPAIVIRKGEGEDIPSLREIMTQFRRFWPQAPTFMLSGSGDPVQDYIDWYNQPNRHFWVASLDGRPVGQIRIQTVGESFISEHPDIMNITSAFVSEESRSTGIGAMLLAEVQKWLQENNYPLCGVDFEAINVTGNRFWNKHFTPYCYSVVRRIDERI